MSQLPPPPQDVNPGDFAPIGTPVGPGAPLPQKPRVNGWAVASLLSSLASFLLLLSAASFDRLLEWAPYAMALLAVITGIVGLNKANDPRYSSGRGLAIGGTVLGAVSLAFWLFVSPLFVGVITASGQPRQLAQEFVRMTSDGAIGAAMQHASPMLGRARVEQLAAQMQEWGPCQDVTSYSSSINVEGGITTCELSGTATFTGAERPFTMILVKEGDAWKVSGLEFE